GKVLADRTKALRDHLLGRRADHHVIAILHGHAEQFVADRTAYRVDIHSQTSYLAMSCPSRNESLIHAATAGCSVTRRAYAAAVSDSFGCQVLKRITTGANIASAIVKSPNRNGPPYVSRHSLHIASMRAMSASAPGVAPLPGNDARMFIHMFERRSP